MSDFGTFSSSSVDKVIRNNHKKVFLLNYMNVFKGDEIIEKKLVKNTASVEQLKKFNVEKGDVFITPSSETKEEIGFAKTSLKNIDNCVFSYHLIRFKQHSNIFFDEFIDYIFKHSTSRLEMYRKSVGVQRLVLNSNFFKTNELKIPIINEQRKIISLLRAISNLITLHHRKLNL